MMQTKTIIVDGQEQSLTTCGDRTGPRRIFVPSQYKPTFNRFILKASGQTFVERATISKYIIVYVVEGEAYDLTMDTPKIENLERGKGLKGG